MLKNAIQTFKGELFFRDQLHLYVNRASESFDSPYHDHDFVELAYVAEGRGFHHTQVEVNKVSKGQLFFLPIGFSHVFRPISSDKVKHPLNVYNCLFHTQLVEKLFSFTADEEVRNFLASIRDGSLDYFTIHDQDERIEKLFQSLHREYTLPRAGSSDYLNTLLLQLLIMVQRIRISGVAQASIDESVPKLSDFDPLLRYIEQHCDQELTLAHLATVSRWSERHLQRLFKKHTEQTFNRYLQSCRIQQSCELLKATQLKINVIAERVGYKDMGSYLAVFKRNVGCTPSEYRKSHA